jgi:adenylate kinase family enzyme
VERVAVVGASGSGKTTVGRALAGALGCEHVELDAIHHQPDWTSLPRDEFRARVESIAAGPSWVVDGNYRAVRDLVWARADTLVWLDLPRTTTVRRVARRTLRRAVTRQELWHGNREALRNLARRDPERNILRWAWVKQPLLVEQYERAVADPANAHLRVLRLRTPAEVRAFLRSLPGTGGRRARRR